MKTYNEFLAEQQQLNEEDDTLRRMTFLAKKEGFEFKAIKKVGRTSFKVGDFTFGNKGDGQWQIVDKGGKEIDYLFNKKLGDIAKLMGQYAKKMNESFLNEASDLSLAQFKKEVKKIIKDGGTPEVKMGIKDVTLAGGANGSLVLFSHKDKEFLVKKETQYKNWLKNM
ncbi:internal virion protein [Pectobacterium bacteriophage PM2]|uniref:Uncharacterized protein n=1 Tax=Pectobacterium bacteriophage PM2 TaxID=1429794 RepID=A0A0A0PZH8_9CAUD|nr:internal virion protein [Pectobacterium bacteriophage PM2]AHY25094.1 hypothetical protein PM2_132 [Pectobacterium bacteriophage PM2]